VVDKVTSKKSVRSQLRLCFLYITTGGRQSATRFDRLWGHLQVMCKRKCVSYSRVCSFGDLVSQIQYEITHAEY